MTVNSTADLSGATSGCAFCRCCFYFRLFSARQHSLAAAPGFSITENDVAVASASTTKTAVPSVYQIPVATTFAFT
jgi:hypothetical protein